MPSRTDCPIFGRWIARALYHEVAGRLVVWHDEVPGPLDPAILPLGLLFELAAGTDAKQGDLLSLLTILPPWPEAAGGHAFLGQFCRTPGHDPAPPEHEVVVEFTLAIGSSAGRDEFVLPGIDPGSPVYRVLVNGKEWQAELCLASRGKRMWSSVPLSRHAYDRAGVLRKIRPALPGFQLFERLPG